jgi:putative membrane protein
MAEPTRSDSRLDASGNPNRARDHLANERTFLAWVRTGIAIVVFGFAIGRFAIAIREFMQVQGHVSHTAGVSVWFGTVAILGGVLLTFTGLLRYRRTREQLESASFEPAGIVIDLVGILTALFGLMLAGYLVYIARRL